MTSLIVRREDEQRIAPFSSSVNGDTTVTKLKNGGWIAAWTGPGPGGSGTEIYVQRYNADGSTKDGIQRIHDRAKAASLSEASIAALDDGGWIVTFNYRELSGGSGIYQHRYNADGSLASSLAAPSPLTSVPKGGSSVTEIAPGQWLVTWMEVDGTGNASLYQRLCKSDGTMDAPQQVSSGFASAKLETSVTVLEHGGWVVTWTAPSQEEDRSGTAIFQQRYDAGGRRMGDRKLVNTFTADNQNGASVTALDDGGWIVTWQSFGQDGYGYGIYQQRYTSTGARSGGEQLVNTHTDFAQENAKVVGLDDGGWMVVWQSFGQDSFGTGLFQQRFAADGSRIGGEQRVNTTTTGNERDAAVAAWEDGWVVTWSSEYNGRSDIYQSRYRYVAAFGEGRETGTGTDAGDLFEVRNGGFAAGDILDGRGGVDTLRMIESGALDLTAPNLLADVEIVQGSAGNDTIVTNAGRLSGVVGLQGNGGSDELRLAADTYDLTGKFISGFETITLLGSASVRFADKATALLAHSQTRAGTLTLTGGSFSGAELGTLFTQGLISITDGNGTHEYVSPTVQATLAPVSLPMTEAATPFADAVVAGSPGMILTATVTMSAPDQGRFVAAKGEYNPRTGVYTVTGTAAEVQAALRALAFDPRDRAAVINSSEKTTLSLVVGDAIQSTGPLVAVVDSIATNVAPGVPVLSHAYIQENAKAGEVVGDVTAIDPNPGDPLTIELVDNAGGRFVLGSDGKLRVASGAVLDHETGASHRIAIRVADAGKLVAEKTFTIRVDDIPIEEMSGTSRSDVLVGGSGKDKLYGKLGNDKLTGGLGQDIFVFDTKPSKKANLDKLVDFSVKDDAIWLDNAVFTKLGKAGSAAAPAALKSGLFATAKAKDKNDHVIYDKAKGVLLYDADGSGKGKAVEIATLAKGLALKASDFFVV